MAEPKADAGARLAELAMQNLVFHKAPASAFKKDSGFKRDDAFSDKLAKQVEASVKGAIESLFDVTSIETSPYVKEASKADVAIAAERRKAYDAMKTLSADVANQMYPEFAEAKAEEPVIQAEE